MKFYSVVQDDDRDEGDELVATEFDTEEAATAFNDGIEYAASLSLSVVGVYAAESEAGAIEQAKE